VLAGRRLADQDVAGRDARSNDETDVPHRREAVVEGRQRALGLGGCLDRPQGVIVAPDRDAEDRDDRVPDDLLDGPTVGLEHRPHRVEVEREHAAQ
jgi:hypothetical protein